MADMQQSRLSPRLVMGVAVIIIGVLLTLRNLGVPGMQDPLAYWPLILVVIGLGKVARPRDTPGRGPSRVPWPASSLTTSSASSMR